MLDLIKMQREYFKELEKEIKDKLNLKRIKILNFTEKHDLNTVYSNEVHTKLIYNIGFIDEKDTAYEIEVKREIDFINYDEEMYRHDLLQGIKTVIETRENINNIRLITIED